MGRVGGVEAARKAVRYRTIDRLYRRDKLLLIENRFSNDGEGHSVPGVEIRILEEADWSPLGQSSTMRTIKRFQERVKRGRTGLVAWRGDLPIGYTWISQRLDPDIEYYPLSPPADAVYGWDLYVNRDERNRGVGSALVAARLEYARELGFRRMWRLVAPDNAPALRTLEKPGSQVRLLSEVVFVSVLGRMRRQYEVSG
jgi:ribosomal protein S18 acetylase RimI-like enzyme